MPERVNERRGHLLFLMFLSSEDKEAKDNLFIYMRNIKRMVKLKTYGSHFKGDFKVYIDEYKRQCFIDELQLSNVSDNPFDFERF